jgi:hypothetical protein
MTRSTPKFAWLITSGYDETIPKWYLEFHNHAAISLLLITKFCKYILHLMGNQDKGYAEVKIQKIQDGGRRHFEFFRLL